MSNRWSLLPASTPRAAFGMIVRNEARLGRRKPVALFAGAVVPTFLLVLFGSLRPTNIPVKALGGLTDFTVYVPIFLAMVVAALALFGLPVALASYRQQGILRRLPSRRCRRPGCSPRSSSSTCASR